MAMDVISVIHCFQLVLFTDKPLKLNAHSELLIETGYTGFHTGFFREEKELIMQTTLLLGVWGNAHSGNFYYLGPQNPEGL